MNPNPHILDVGFLFKAKIVQKKQMLSLGLEEIR